MTKDAKAFRRELYTGDNLAVLRGMNSAIADLIYLDPPFNSGKQWENPIEAQGKKALASFKDTWTLSDINRDEHELLADEYPALAAIIEAMGAVNGGSWKSYMIYMAVRLVEMRRILKPTGSIYLHCDPTMSHGLKLAMDAIFGLRNFRNEITWQRNDGRGKGSQFAAKKFGDNTDSILFYSKSDKAALKATKCLDRNSEEMIKKFNKIDENGRRYQTGIPHFCSRSMGARPNLCFEWRGFKNPHPSGWRLSKERLEEEYQKGNIVIKDNGSIERRKYLDDYEGEPLDNCWVGIPRIVGAEGVGYPTQKPLALLERIIKASSNEGDLILDPFCGCATTCVAAEKLKRQWIGIDISDTAADIVKRRLESSSVVLFNAVSHFTKPPKRTDITDTRTPNAKLRPILYRKQKRKCNGCEHEERMEQMEIDHILARAKGGLDIDKNLQLLCGNCNRIKGHRGMRYLKRELYKRRLQKYDTEASTALIGGDGV